MNTGKLRAIAFAVFTVSLFSAFAQSPYLYRMTFKGTCFQTNSSGDFVATTLTEQTFLEDAARASGLDPKSLALVYHLNNGIGDTIDVVDSTGASIGNLFGFYFGDDLTLGRTAATNSSLTEIRRLDYIYTLNNSAYTSFNSHSMGSVFLAKRMVAATGPNGSITNTVVDGQMQWIVNPLGTSGTKLCTGKFTTTTPFP
ncbi:MAG TPA: hypothetical protein VEC99_10740 [Clostridia bacterium]|nr:hypothetical protein [Clostridia bacterium]